MKAADFRRIALSMPEAIESEHMAHPDFRVGGKIFATLGYPDQDHGMVNLPLEEQARMLRCHPKIFFPAKGAWGKQGSTCVHLEGIDMAALRPVMEIAWRERAPRSLLRKASA
ncbi:MAG TPA: MmcQ/YjbR family DNA-binding protein [Chthoniobacterales bacterium]|nr:MmcQ/YjbR family DNA-binding protein [Chthoniobacterales bacterium]